MLPRVSSNEKLQKHKGLQIGAQTLKLEHSLLH